MVEKRKDDRQSLDYPCWLSLGPGQPPIECRLSNVSKSGALLVCDTADVQIADEFALYLTRDGNIGRQCKVVRREKNTVGLHFVSRKVQKPNWLDALVVDA